MAEMEDHLDSIGLDTAAATARARSQSRGRRPQRRESEADAERVEAMDVDVPDNSREALIQRARSMPRIQSNRRETGVTSLTSRSKAERLAKLGQRKMNRMARQGEADRHIGDSRPKHLVSSIDRNIRAKMFHSIYSLL